MVSTLTTQCTFDTTPKQLSSGIPQGSILSPIIFTIYCADLKEWVKHSKLLNYAHDTSSSHSGQDQAIVVRNLEEDATNILQFMASNGLVANPSKTEYMLINSRDKETTNTIKVGSSEIQQVKSAKLLGIFMNEDQKWTSHFWGEKRTAPSTKPKTVRNQENFKSYPKGQSSTSCRQHLDIQT